MRLSLRKLCQAGFLFASFVFLNCIYISIVRSDQHSYTVSTTGRGGGSAGATHHKLQNGHDKVKDTRDTLRLDWRRQWPFAGWFNGLDGPRTSSDRVKRSLKSESTDQKLLSGRDVGTVRGSPDVADRHPAGVPTTSQHRETDLDDIFISVKTTQKFHKERLQVILDTWWILARDQTYFFTDVDDPELQKQTRGHVINTQCSSSHARWSLCCKMSVEYDTFITSEKRWFCHVDDDTYLNVPALVSLVREYNHTGDWYLGKPSLNHPIEKQDINDRRQKTSFWFATGGAGFCLSRAMALKMMPYTAGGKFKSVCDKIRLPDDCTIGFIVYYYLRKQLTVIKSFHSHLEGLWTIRKDNVEKQLTFSYLRSRLKTHPNVVNVSMFNDTEDPTRFKSIHCILYPNFPGCPTR